MNDESCRVLRYVCVSILLDMNLFYRIILVVVCLLQSILLFGQKSYEAQHVSYDLSQKSFNDKLSYVKLIIIEGLPNFNGNTYDLIQLEVFSTSSAVKAKIEKKEDAIKDLKVEIYDEKDESKQLKLQLELKELENDLKVLNEEVNLAVPLSSSVWKKNSSSSKFSFELTSLLEMDESYEFKFTLFEESQGFLPKNKLIENVSSGINAQLTSNKGFVSVDSLQSIIVNVVNKQINDLAGNAKLYNEKLEEKVDFSSAVNPALRNAITNCFIWKERVMKSTKELRGNQSKIDSVLFENLPQSNLKSSDSSFKEICFNADSSAFRKWSIENKVPTVSALKAVNYMIQLNRSSRIFLQGEQKNLEKEIQKVDSLTVGLVQGVYLKKLSIKSEVSSSTVSTEMEGKKIGTMYGIGNVFLWDGLEGEYINELTQYGCVNFRFGSYDNRLKGKDAFKNAYSRWSIMFGVATTKIQYKGQELSNTRIGVKPMIGFSYEPAKRIDVNFGIVAFNQGSAVSEQSTTLTKFRPFLGVAFDFDAINEIIKQ